MAFQGSLAELHLPDIIQLVSVSGKTGVFHLIDGDHRGQIWLVDGRIVHAELEALNGEDAVYALAIWRTGEFRFDAGVAAPRQTIQKSNTNLLMEAARRLDEWRVLSKKIPSVDLVPEFAVIESREGQINLNTMEWLLLSKIDGHRTVRQIAAAAGMGVLDAAKLLYGLVATNLIRLKEAGAAQSPSSPEPAAQAPTVPAPLAPSAQTPSAHVPSAQTPSAQTPSARVSSAHVPSAERAQPLRTLAPATTANAPGLARLVRLRDDCVSLLGPVGESVVQKHYLRARGELERGAGPEVIDDAVQQIARAAGILKGSAVAEAVLQLLKGPR
jgi:hypothetical protein